ncbi:DUF2141 domain-containing protein [Sphingorhabdus sp. Alg239-R122]|uniref:DUF2141 domain-containing protein n=1 Tax=Sphingorhabdus sp. Alg239-R122 TaxID=2305989 RepID=UPI0013DAD298|nr:DUF2141 domain-containing protein [Sphingorhabdus sp. Alg239-R122]
MFKFSNVALFGGSAAMALALVATPAGAQRQKISNDMSKCVSGAGPAVLVEVRGFKKTTGRIRVQAYEGTSAKWLKKGAWINRIDVPVRANGGKMRFCMPLPKAGTYGIAVRHDMDGNGKSGWNDGGGFTGNPNISLTNLKPSIKKSAIRVGNGVARANVVLNYRRGLSIKPIG